ncbi:MAG TPA: TonB-dependent receptor, partial [Pyrinomonadaceae bacterium]|nr:TonB-dependent receptor [Pyrinomonadaceae bacterium]
GTGNTLPQSRLVDVYQQQDTFSATLGNHFVKVGFDLRQQKVNNFFLPNFLGTYRFRDGGTSLSAVTPNCPLCRFFTAAGNTRGGTATAFENLLLARPERINFALGNPRIKTNQNDYFFFVQDDWRVRSNLTLNLGLRYEYSSTPFNPIIEAVNEREANPSTAIFSSAFPIQFRTAQKLKTDKNNFAPRVGFAYSPNIDFLGDRFSNGRTVIRGGFGIAYDPSFFNIVLNTVTAAPFAGSGSFFNTPGTANQVFFPFLPKTTAELNTTPGTNGGDPRLFNQTRVDPNFYSPYTMGFNFGIQQELFKDTVLEVRYVGSRIVGQYQTLNGNPNIRFLNNAAQCLGLAAGAFTNGNVAGSPAATAADACNGTGFQNRPGTNGNGRIDPNFGAVRIRTNGARATYDSLQVRFDTRVSDIIFNANYTFSKTIDNASEIFSTAAGGQSVAVPQNPFDSTVGERGLSAFHQKHNFTANFIYELPFFKDQQGFVGKLLGGYQFAGIIRLGSGRPYTPVQFFTTYDPTGDALTSGGLGPLRPYNGNSNAPVGTIAFSYEAACNFEAVTIGPNCSNYTVNGVSAANPGAATPGQFIIFNTLRPGSAGTVVPNIQAAIQQARLIYNDSGFVPYGLSFADATA